MTVKQALATAAAGIATKGTALAISVAIASTMGSVAGNQAVAAQNRAFVEIEQQRDMPRRGQSKTGVRNRYGEPQSMSPAVGQPPISKWQYPGFTVYFEYSHVITTVAEEDGLPATLDDIQ